MSEFLLMASPDGDVLIPATFYGEAHLVFGPPPEEEEPQACGPDMVPGVFHAEIVYTFDLLTRLGFLPVPPTHPDYPLYLDALAEHLCNPPEPMPVVVPDFNDPDTIYMPFEKKVLIPPEAYWRYGLVLPPRPGSAVASEPAPQPVRETQPVPPVRRLERGLGGGLMVPLPPPRPRIAKTPEQWEAQRRVLQEITDWGFRDLLQRRAARPAKAALARPYDALLGCLCDTSNAVSPGELHDAALMPFLGASDRRAPTLVARDQSSAAPLPPGDFDAFLAFLADPDGHPLPAPVQTMPSGRAAVSHRPSDAGAVPVVHAGAGPGKSAPPPWIQTSGPGLPNPGSVSPMVEMAAGAAVTAAGAGELMLGIVMTPEGIGVPVAIDAAPTIVAGVVAYSDGLDRLHHRHADRRARSMTAHPEPRPVPPLIAVVEPPAPEGMSAHPDDGARQDAGMAPAVRMPADEGFVLPLSVIPLGLSIYGDGTPDKINVQKQDKHSPGAQTDERRSTFTDPSPQKLLDVATGRGKPANTNMIRGTAGFKEHVRFKSTIGIHRERETGIETPTNRATIHYAKTGVHIVPAHPIGEPMEELDP